MFLAPGSPAFNSQDCNFVCHQKGSEAHADGEEEHGHEMMLFHAPDDISGARHEDQSTGDETEGGDEFARRAGWVERSWW